MAYRAITRRQDMLASTPLRARTMPRQPRLELPGFPLHVTQRGVNRAATFVDAGDYTRYLHWLSEALTEHEVALHAYVLMGNHVHLLATPSANGGISRAMAQVGSRYVRSFNRRHGRTGTLWEGRFKSSLVDSDRYALAVCRYIELNPVRAGLVDRPERYPWSSVHHHLGMKPDPMITSHPCLRSLASEEANQAAAYRELLCESLPEEDLTAIRQHIGKERSLGGPCFQAMVEAAIGRPVGIRPRGRPCKVAGE